MGLGTFLCKRSPIFSIELRQTRPWRMVLIVKMRPAVEAVISIRLRKRTSNDRSGEGSSAMALKDSSSFAIGFCDPAVFTARDICKFLLKRELWLRGAGRVR